MVRDSAATRNRILEAAIGEFAAYGLAGARVGRIAGASGANQRSIYVYFESKEGLFNAALQRVIGDLVGAVPLTEDDLPGYAGRMFDYLLEHPEALRMSLWRHLERPAAGPDAADVYAEKVEAMSRGGSGPTASGLPPTDLLVLVQGLTSAWLISPQDLLAADSSDPYSADRLSAHRAAVVEAARRLSAPAF
ncbi:MAG: Transcriptional regulator, AcrR family [uncultured Rubrobacteraceae bacterium]|uniref:Transcriptional regulator, AcrR family n=1 Tax=uncultured Rubrobacteraceae bacterium TaxID=349277 RepID=A0A6J4SH96_9ACTN|nr:MAG: Transcriptional regulator, AcrR family [uncultured Rubrobacteraceae bacterium]